MRFLVLKQVRDNCFKSDKTSALGNFACTLLIIDTTIQSESNLGEFNIHDNYRFVSIFLSKAVTK